MGFVIAVGAAFAALLVWAAVIDWRTKRQGRDLRSADDIGTDLRGVRRAARRVMFRGTKIEQLFPDEPDSRGKQTPYGQPKGPYRDPDPRRGRH